MEWTKIDDTYKHLSPQAIVQRIVELDQTYILTSKLQLFSKALHSLNKNIDPWNATLYIISLQLDIGFQIYPYTQEQEKMAFAHYQEIEKSFLWHSDKLVVLVWVDDIDDLQKAYPSFFGDNDLFLGYIQTLQNIYL